MKADPLTKYFAHRNLGLFILRLVIGGIFAYLGFIKLQAGEDRWAGLGGAVFGKLGMDLPQFVTTGAGFMASLFELIGGLLLILGFWSRVGALTLVFVMIGAVIVLWGAEAAKFTYPVAMLGACLALMFTGPGAFALGSDHKD